MFEASSGPTGQEENIDQVHAKEKVGSNSHTLRRQSTMGCFLRFVLRFLYRVVSTAMGFFFRTKNDDRLPTAQLISDSSHAKSRAKFLKACDPLAGTPAAIQKQFGKLKVSPPCGKDADHLRFHKLQQVVQPSEPPTPTKVCEEWVNGTLEHTPSSCITNAYFNKSVQFQYDTDLSSCGSSNEYGGQHKSKTGEMRLSLDQSQDAIPTPEKGFYGNVSKVEGSLSSWFKPAAVIQEERNRRRETARHICKTPRDRPIIGMVGAFWNEDEESHIHPKLWDGKGIPNSTTKYKEDQKVNWHATPFEERLKKALSKETSVSQWKHIC